MSSTDDAGHDAPTVRRPARRGTPWYAVALKPLASLRLTCALFALSVALVFFGTLAQMNDGIWTVVSKYFWSEYVKVDVQLLVQFAAKFDIFEIVPKDAKVEGWFPIVGGRLLGFMLLVNLLAAHLLRFKLSWARSGVIVLHSGMILLFLGEFVTREFAVEQRMVIDEGKSANYADDSRHVELAFVDGSRPTEDRVAVVSQRLLQRGGRIAHPDLPVDIHVDRFFANSDIVDAQPGDENPATAGLGLSRRAEERPEVSGVAAQQGVDLPSAYLTFFRKGSEERLGTYLFSVLLDSRSLDETVTAGGKAYGVSMRFVRHYKPYSLKLVKFRFDKYVGTEMAKNFSSELVLDDPERGARHGVLIKMNDPLRYRGETIYQADFDKRTEKTTILQVVHNPGWLIPYVSCAMVALGMLLHFGINLGKFLTRTDAAGVAARGAAGAMILGGLWLGLLAVFCGRPRRGAGGDATPQAGWERALPWLAVACAALFLLAKTFAPATGPYDLAAFGELPVLDGGRIKPLDTLARVNMRVMSSREEFADESSHMQPAIRWYLDAVSARDFRRDPGPAVHYRLFRIENDRVRAFLGLEKREGFRYSFQELQKKHEEFLAAVESADARPQKERDLFDQKLLELGKQVSAFTNAMSGKVTRLLPSDGQREWRTVGDANAIAFQSMRERLAEQFADKMDRDTHTPDEEREFKRAARQAYDEALARDPAHAAWEGILEAYRDKDEMRFNELVAKYRVGQYPTLSVNDGLRVKLEAFLNVFAPFYHAIVLYVLAFVMTAAGWVAFLVRPSLGEAIRRAAFGVLAVTFAVHVAALFSRMYLMDRPLVFVTNLYSSAVFIGAGVVAMCLVIERLFPIGLGNAVAALLGAGTCIVAHNLAAGGDTLEMLVAVLDTNFWLATHVTTVTLGYAATYVAGAIGMGYLALGLLTPFLDRPVDVGGKPQTLGRTIGTILYGVVCFATLLSFVGTVLGGIWADQSWGRFWGWDPKENGAVLIVAWNALILHARWAGLVKDRGVAVLALVGNMITTWSWFGTNQLGVGLHNYGFNNTLAAGCTVTWLTHLGLIAAGLIPSRFWQSTGRPTRMVAKAAPPERIAKA